MHRLQLGKMTVRRRYQVWPLVKAGESAHVGE